MDVVEQVLLVDWLLAVGWQVGVEAFERSFVRSFVRVGGARGLVFVVVVAGRSRSRITAMCAAALTRFGTVLAASRSDGAVTRARQARGC